MNSYLAFDVIESRFYISLGRFMQSFACLDLNLGLCIRMIANRDDCGAIHPFLKRLTTHQKLEVLKELIAY